MHTLAFSATHMLTAFLSIPLPCTLTAPPSTPLSVADCRGIVKTLVCGMKTITWGAGSCKIPGSAVDYCECWKFHDDIMVTSWCRGMLFVQQSSSTDIISVFMHDTLSLSSHPSPSYTHTLTHAHNSAVPEGISSSRDGALCATLSFWSCGTRHLPCHHPPQ